MNLQLFADTLNYSKVDNPYNFYLNKPTWTKGDIKKVYNLEYYYQKIPNYDTITTLPEENAEYIKEALPNVSSCYCMMGSYYYGDGFIALTSIDTTRWDTSNITNMTLMFSNCSSLRTLDVSKWDTSKVTNMNSMFNCCKSLTTLDASKWDTSKVINMSGMFNYCNLLKTLDLSNWDITRVTNMSDMFFDCNALIELDVSNWDTSRVTSMKQMFFYCNALTNIKGVIDMKSCTICDNMFINCDKLKGVKIKNPPLDFEKLSGLRKDQYEIVS